MHNMKEGCDVIKDMLIPTYYPIYSLSMANFLVRNGFDIVKVDDNERDNRLKKFLFYDNANLRNAMTTYKRQGV